MEQTQPPLPYEYSRRIADHALNAKEMAMIRNLAERKVAAKDPRSIERYKLDGRDDVLRSVEGFMAEYAACKHYGASFRQDVLSGRGDAGYDIAVRSKAGTRMWYLGVKATRYMPPILKVKERELTKSRCDAYLLCHVDTQTATVELCGWISREDVMKLPTGRMRADGPLNRIAHLADLNSCSASSAERRMCACPECDAVFDPVVAQSWLDVG